MAQPFPNELKHLYDNAEFIGSGGFAQVFKARRKDSRVVAVKIPLKLDEITGKSFLREITSWQRLNHQNIVSLFDANILPIPYLEQEYMDGGSLEGIKKPLEIAQAYEIVFEIAEGLKYAHKQGIVHRDLKPQNVLLTKDNVPKITDWGMSRVVDAFKSSTQHGYTPAYAAPEQISPKKFGKPDERTDIYQLGVILYNLITNDLPFKGDDLVEIGSAIVMEEPIPPSKSNPEAWEVELIVLKCLSKKKEDRYQNVEELQEKLFELIEMERERKERERKTNEGKRRRNQREEEERAKKDREEQERLRRIEEEKEKKIIEKNERKEREEVEEREKERRQREEKGLKKQIEDAKTRKRDELSSLKEKKSSQKMFLAVALVLSALLLGWMYPFGSTNAPEIMNSTPSPTPNIASTEAQSNVTPMVSPAQIAKTPPPTLTNSIGMEFVSMPSGEFNMGSPTSDSKGYDFERPVHNVKISYAFYMGKYEVTQKQWRDVMGTSPSYFKGDNLPVEQVSWDDVQDFIKKLNEKEGASRYRLPSEAEWEYAARSGTTTRFSFGDDESILGDYAWCDSNSTHDVGQKKPNPWGLYDVHGNVWEWTQDIYQGSYSGAPNDGSAWESGVGSFHVLRGGSWLGDVWYCRSAIRPPSDPGARSDYRVGFRLVRDL